MFRRRFITFVSVAASAATASAPVCAGAFLLREGEAKIFATSLVSTGDRYFDGAGRRRDRAPLTKIDVQLYGEYGWSDALTLIAATTAQRLSLSGEDRSSRTGLGRSELGARVRLAERDGWVVSAQSSAIIAGARSRRRATVGETDDQLDLRGLVAWSFAAFNRPAFIDVQAGYRARTGDPADEVRLDATLGLRATSKLLLMAQSFNTVATARWSGPYPLKQRIHKAQLAALYDVSETFSLYAAAFVTPTARDALDERGLVLGVGWRF